MKKTSLWLITIFSLFSLFISLNSWAGKWHDIEPGDFEALEIDLLAPFNKGVVLFSEPPRPQGQFENEKKIYEELRSNPELRLKIRKIYLPGEHFQNLDDSLVHYFRDNPLGKFPAFLARDPYASFKTDPSGFVEAQAYISRYYRIAEIAEKNWDQYVFERIVPNIPEADGMYCRDELKEVVRQIPVEMTRLPMAEPQAEQNPFQRQEIQALVIPPELFYKIVSYLDGGDTRKFSCLTSTYHSDFLHEGWEKLVSKLRIAHSELQKKNESNLVKTDQGVVGTTVGDPVQIARELKDSADVLKFVENLQKLRLTAGEIVNWDQAEKEISYMLKLQDWDGFPLKKQNSQPIWLENEKMDERLLKSGPTVKQILSLYWLNAKTFKEKMAAMKEIQSVLRTAKEDKTPLLFIRALLGATDRIVQNFKL